MLQASLFSSVFTTEVGPRIQRRVASCISILGTTLGIGERRFRHRHATFPELRVADFLQMLHCTVVVREVEIGFGAL